MNDHGRNCIELSLESSDDEDHVVMSGQQQAKSPDSDRLLGEATKARVNHVELSLDTSDEEDNGSTREAQYGDSVPEGVTVIGHTTKRAAVEVPPAEPPKKKKPKSENLRALVLSRAFVNIASVVSRLRSNLSLLASVEDALVLAAQQSSRQHTFKDFQAMAEVYVATLACNVLYGDGQLMKKMADFHSAHHRTALTTFANLMEKDSSALHVADQTYKASRTMVAAYLASIPHLGRDHASMLSTLGFTTAYLEAVMTVVAKSPRKYTERGLHVLSEWLNLASTQTVGTILIRSGSSIAQLNTFLIFFSCLLAAVPRDVVFAKCGSAVLSLLKILFQGDLWYGDYDKMESEIWRQLVQCLHSGSPTILELPQLVLEYLQQDVPKAVVLQSRVAMIFFLLLVLHRKTLGVPVLELDTSRAVHLDNHLTLHIIHGLAQCQLMGFEERQVDLLDAACTFAVESLIKSCRLVDRFGAGLPKCVWQQILVFPSLISTSVPTAYDRLNFRFRQCQSIGELFLSSTMQQQYMGHVLHLSQQLHLLMIVVKTYCVGGAPALVSFVESNLLAANLLWKGIFCNFIAVSMSENYSASDDSIEWLRAVCTMHCLRFRLADYPRSESNLVWTYSDTLAFFLIHTLKMICIIPVSNAVVIASSELIRKPLLEELKLPTKVLPVNVVENLFCIQCASELVNMWTLIFNHISKRLVASAVSTEKPSPGFSTVSSIPVRVVPVVGPLSGMFGHLQGSFGYAIQVIQSFTDKMQLLSKLATINMDKLLWESPDERLGRLADSSVFPVDSISAAPQCQIDNVFASAMKLNAAHNCRNLLYHIINQLSPQQVRSLMSLRIPLLCARYVALKAAPLLPEDQQHMEAVEEEVKVLFDGSSVDFGQNVLYCYAFLGKLELIFEKHFVTVMAGVRKILGTTDIDSYIYCLS